LPQGQRSGLAFPAAFRHIQVNAPARLTDQDYSDLAALVREAIDAEPYRIGPRINRLRTLLAKLEPEPDSLGISPYPAPRPSGEPSLLYRKLKGGRRRR
jgi:hypothetical protein